ncbi:rhomboid family intramembrane serine protease [Halalkalicoccus salilacus]|uniref:rhomboid family intramembrane serine protease n=1 Tax=Halalkalicoccus salilacus TaxID=3117459 RepID=UPI00300ED988
MARSPTLETLVLLVVVFVLQQALSLVGIGLGLFALAAPLAERPWTLVTAVYAHAGPVHLVSNLVGLALFGLLVERATTRVRFHGFVLVTGMLAGIAEVLIGMLWDPVAVIGTSGAVFALMGYLLAGNPVSDAVMGRFRPGRRVQVALVIVLATAITLLTASAGVALIAHFTGFSLGLVSGRLHLLRA